jgi:hypothetical protein
VIEGETGAFYETGDWAALAAVVGRFPAEHVEPRACVANAARFSAARFRQAFGEAVLATYAALSPSSH